MEGSISTQNLNSLPDSQNLKTICKAIAVLDAVICPEWEYRYYSFYSKWAEDEQCFEMRDGSGDQMLILFKGESSIINGFAHEFPQPDKSKLTQYLPAIFHEFIFGEPVNSIGSTFCIWTEDGKVWHTEEPEYEEDGSAELLRIFDGRPQTYVDWANEYFEGSYKGNGIPLEAVARIYQGTILNREIVLALVEKLEDWDQLKADLEEIDYPFDFSDGDFPK